MARLRHVGMLVTLTLMSLVAQRSSCAPQPVDPQGQVCKAECSRKGSNSPTLLLYDSTIPATFCHRWQSCSNCNNAVLMASSRWTQRSGINMWAAARGPTHWSSSPQPRTSWTSRTCGCASCVPSLAMQQRGTVLTPARTARCSLAGEPAGCVLTCVCGEGIA